MPSSRVTCFPVSSPLFLEGQALWRRFLAPHRSELRADTELVDDLAQAGLGDVLDRAQGWLHPGVAWELLLGVHLLPEVLLHYTALCRLGVTDLLLPTRPGDGAPADSGMWCHCCGHCCMDMAFTIDTTAKDLQRLGAHLRTRGRANATPSDDPKTFAQIWAGQRRPFRGEAYLLTCPFLTRQSPARTRCAIYSARPAVCQGFQSDQCDRFLSYRRDWVTKRQTYTGHGEAAGTG